MLLILRGAAPTAAAGGGALRTRPTSPADRGGGVPDRPRLYDLLGAHQSTPSPKTYRDPVLGYYASVELHEDTEQMSTAAPLVLLLPPRPPGRSRDGPSIWDPQEPGARPPRRRVERHVEPGRSRRRRRRRRTARSARRAARRSPSSLRTARGRLVSRCEEMHERALGVGDEPLGGERGAHGGARRRRRLGADDVARRAPSAAEPPRVRSARSRPGLGDGLAHLNLRVLGDGTEAPPEGGFRGARPPALDGPPLLEEEEQSSEEAEAQA